MMQLQAHRQNLILVSVALIPLILFAGLSLGSAKISLHEALSCLIGDCLDQTTKNIVLDIRLPRILAALISGAGLALSGTLLQSLFRNPLADAGILGITSGASLGVAILIMSGLSAGISAYSHGFESIFAVALIGSILTTIFVIAMIRFVANSTSLLLVGIMINWILGSMISVLGILAQYQNLQVFYTWTLGSFAGITWNSLIYLYTVIPLAAISSYVIYKRLDAILLGESYAATMGIKIRSLRRLAIILSSTLVAVITATAGPVGFIGIAGPYLARLTVNSGSHKIIIPLSLTYGALLAACADIIARTIMAPIDIPISIITAMIGAPLIVSLLIKRKGEGLSH